jgi:large subunit ribosomal protein L17
MRHGVKGRKLGRTASHRLATLKSLATSVLKHKRIKTTVSKAKEARALVDKLITKAKRNDLHARRLVAQFVNDKEVVKELFNEVVPKVGDRPGGYTRVVKLGRRLGDAAELAILELVDYNDVMNEKAVEKKEQREAKAQAKKEKEAEEAQEAAPVAQEEK